MKKHFELITSAKNTLQIDLYQQKNPPRQKFIIAVHGFKGFKDWGFFPFAGKYFAELGYSVLTFNFSHNGIGSDPLNFTELEKFASNTFSLEVEELSEVIEAVKSGYFGEIENPEIGMIGHSRGGAISLLSAFRTGNIKALVTWAAVSKFDRYSERQKKEWIEKGYLEVINSRTKQVMKLNKTLLEDIIRNSDDKLNIKKAAGNVGVPWLILHGENDLAVPVKEAKQLYEWADKNLTELIIIPKTGHTFDVVHPMEKTTAAFKTVLEKTGDFFQQNL